MGRGFHGMLATCPKVRRQLGFGTRRLLGKSPVDEGRRLTALKKFEKTKPYVNV